MCRRHIHDASSSQAGTEADAEPGRAVLGEVMEFKEGAFRPLKEARCQEVTRAKMAEVGIKGIERALQAD